MRLCKARVQTGEVVVGVAAEAHVSVLEGIRDLGDVLHADGPGELAKELLRQSTRKTRLAEVTLLAPIDQQEVWAAGVTYKRSQEARERESAGAAKFYDLVYSAPRPELFFKAPAYRVSGPGQRVHIRRDSKWNVPEPELAALCQRQKLLPGVGAVLLLVPRIEPARCRGLGQRHRLAAMRTDPPRRRRIRRHAEWFFAMGTGEGGHRNCSTLVLVPLAA